MAEERRMAITSSPLLAPDDVARHTFTTVRRGFDPKEVRSYLESLAHGLTSLAEREHELLEDLASTERRAQNPVLDEATLVAALGQQTARVLHSAHEVADEQMTKAKEEAERLVSDATEQAQAARASAESEATERMAAIEAECERLVAEATERSSALIEGAEREGDELRTRAKEECRSMVDEAQQLRARVLADLTSRRRLLHAQIEQLRAGRERLAETIDGVRRSVDGIAEDLFTAEDNAREAAEVAGRAAAARADDEPPDDLTELLRAVANATDVEIEVDVDVAAEANDQEANASPEAEVAGHEDTAAPTGKVDALFAKLRAGHDGEEPEGEGPGAAESGPGPSAAAGSTDMPETGPPETAVDLE
ncbi:MAG: DivIVA domain-containing protein, partial [Acidimicrobiales bacterium]